MSSLRTVRLLVYGLSISFALSLARGGEPVAVLSRSEQFLVHGLPMPAAFLPGSQASGVSYVNVDPNLLAVSCERIKEVLLAELGLKDEWRGKIALFLRPVRADNEPIRVTSTHYTDGWGYRLEIPDQVDRSRLVRAVIEVLLLEMANRHAGRQSAELPPWLVEGLSAHLQAVSGLVVERARHERRQEPLKALRERLRKRPPLSWNELSWPDDEPWTAAAAAHYQACAQFLVWELLHLKRGHDCLRDLIAHLSDDLNWQTTFLRVFRSHFTRLVDVEKWWSLSVVHFTGHDFEKSWPREEGWRQLEEILMTPVDVRLSANELPMSSHARLQTILAEWDYVPQRTLLQKKINHLQALRWRVSKEMLGLVDDYLHTLETYVQKRDKTGTAPVLKNETLPNLKILLRDTLRQLDALDAQRLQMQSQTNAPTAVLTR
jgi:hypothetical protein